MLVSLPQQPAKLDNIGGRCPTTCTKGVYLRGPPQSKLGVALGQIGFGVPALPAMHHGTIPARAKKRTSPVTNRSKYDHRPGAEGEIAGGQDCGGECNCGEYDKRNDGYLQRKYAIFSR
jgi:hypothetical protein